MSAIRRSKSGVPKSDLIRSLPWRNVVSHVLPHLVSSFQRRFGCKASHTRPVAVRMGSHALKCLLLLKTLRELQYLPPKAEIRNSKAPLYKTCFQILKIPFYFIVECPSFMILPCLLPSVMNYLAKDNALTILPGTALFIPLFGRMYS